MSVTHSPLNLSDETIQRVKDNGGVVIPRIPFLCSRISLC